MAKGHEGAEIARWLQSMGIAAVVCDYRHQGKGYGHPAPLEDAQQAIRMVRARATDWNLRPDRIGAMGFSAGGHLASALATHFDDGDPEKAYDFWEEFMTPNANHIYCCGPKPLMEEVQALSGHWPEGQIHFEDFNPQSGREFINSSFVVSIKSTGDSFQVNEASTILETLRSNGLRVPSSCESGTCGSCKMRLVAGEVEHRDFVLESDEYDSAIMVCVSRGRGDIEIDFEDY